MSLNIYIGLSEPSFIEHVISSKIKCAGSFNLYFSLLIMIYLARRH